MSQQKPGIEVQFMDSVDISISEENLSSQLKKAFTEADSDTANFVQSSFFVSNTNRYDENFKEISNKSSSNSAAKFEKSVAQYKSLKPKRHKPKHRKAAKGSWLKRFTNLIFDQNG